MAGSDSTVCEQIRTTIVRRLEAHASFSRAPAIVPLRRFSGDPATELESALGAAGRSGLIVTVSEPAIATDQSRSGIGAAQFEVLIAEEPELNRGPGGTQRTASEIEEAVIDSLIGWDHGELFGPIVQAGPVDRPDEGAGMVRRMPFVFGIMIS